MTSSPQNAPQSDDARFEAIYRAHYGRVLAYVLRRATPEVAHDVVADTFLVAWRRLDRLPDEPLPWLLGVARKTLGNHRRGARRRDALLSRLESQDFVRANKDDDAATLAVVDLVRALERLGDTDRDLVELIAWDGLTVGEAAAVLGISSPTCRVRLYRARRRLAAELTGGQEVRTPAAAGSFPQPAKEV